MATAPSQIELSSHWSFNLRNDPKRLAFVLSRYKFASRMLPRVQSILELGCSEGIGAPILTENGARYTGVDLDAPAIACANRNFLESDRKFIKDDFLNKSYGSFSGIVSMDVIEHIYPEKAHEYFETLLMNLNSNGVAVIGTPNQTSEAYASEMSRIGHVNLYTADRLRDSFLKYFRNVFIFGMNDEVMHVGYAPMAHFLIAIACGPRKEMLL